MKSRRKQLKESRLYLLIDKKVLANRDLTHCLNHALRGGLKIIQLRDKHSKRINVLKRALLLHKLLHKTPCLFIVNDSPVIARAAFADGVHIGQGDCSIKAARKIMGKDRIIGVSCRNLKQALRAQNKGADYVAIGPVFETSTKPGCRAIDIKEITRLKKKLKIPFFVIGNINKENIPMLKLSGATRFALCKAIIKAKNITDETRNISRLIYS